MASVQRLMVVSADLFWIKGHVSYFRFLNIDQNMSWVNYHTHCLYCDGKAEPEAYLIRAIEEGFPGILKNIGFESLRKLWKNQWTDCAFTVSGVDVGTRD